MVTLVVLFADIARNTKIYDQFGDTVARDATSAYLKIVTEVAVRLQGRLVKAVGAKAMILGQHTGNPR